MSDDRGPEFDGVKIGRPATGALIDAGYRTLDDLPEDLNELQALHGVGPSAVGRLRDARLERRDPDAAALLRDAVAAALTSPDPVGLFRSLMTASAPAPPVWPHRNTAIRLPRPPRTPVVLTVRFDLNGARPPIWRRLALRGDLTLDVLHDHLQVAMGWTDSHLHRFAGPGVSGWDLPHFVTRFDLEEGDEGTPESAARLDQVLREAGDRLDYLYDFGDSWQHTLKLESVRPATDDDPPARCLAGRGQCPPEDVGGVGSWNEIAGILRTHGLRGLTGELEQYRDWLPEGTDPDHFDVDEVNAELAGRAGGRYGLAGAGTELRELLDRARGSLDEQLADAARAIAQTPTPTEAELRSALRPWQAIVDEAGADGIPLTKAGWMAPASCERLWHNSGLSWEFGKGNREQFTPELSRLREAGVSAGLIRRLHGRLVLTKLGRSALSDPWILADAAASGLVRDRSEFGRDARVVALLLGGDVGTSLSVSEALTAIGWRSEGRQMYLGSAEAHEINSLLSADDPAPRGARRRSPGAAFIARRALFPPA